MIPIEIELNDLFPILLIGSMLALVAVMIPVQIASKLRRMKRRRTHTICRLCGYRFLRPEERGIVSCPHCGAKNK